MQDETFCQETLFQNIVSGGEYIVKQIRREKFVPKWIIWGDFYGETFMGRLSWGEILWRDFCGGRLLWGDYHVGTFMGETFMGRFLWETLFRGSGSCGNGEGGLMAVI